MLTTVNQLKSNDLTQFAQKMLATHMGYRTENQSDHEEHTGAEVIDFEINELGNQDIIDTCNLLYSLNAKTAEDVIKALNDKLGKNFNVLWLASDPFDCLEFYTDGHKHYHHLSDAKDEDGNQIDLTEYTVPQDAILISDIGSDGQLMAVPENFEWEQRVIQ